MRKTTRIATNIHEIADALSLRCEGGHRHVHLVSGRPKNAAIYPPEFCSSVVRGLRLYQHRRAAGIKTGGEIPYLMNFSRADLCDPEEEELCGRFIDDLR